MVKFFWQIQWPEDWIEQYRIKVKRGNPLTANDEMNVRELEQVENFAVNWRGARNLVDKKRLLQMAVVRITLQEQKLVEEHITQPVPAYPATGLV